MSRLSVCFFAFLVLLAFLPLTGHATIETQASSGVMPGTPSPQIATTPGQPVLPNPHIVTTTIPPTNALLATQSTTFIGACQNTNLSICGVLVAVPPGPMSSLITLQTPSPYIHQPFTVECVNSNGAPIYQIVDAAAVTCTLQSCAPSTTNICGLEFSVPIGITAGSSVPLTIPTSALNRAASEPPITINATCMASDGPTAIYKVNSSDISCNVFLCQDAKISICNSEINVSGGAAMGAILNLNMPPPFQNDPFSVQCLGTEGKAPTYHLIDHRAVTCATLPQQ